MQECRRCAKPPSRWTRTQRIGIALDMEVKPTIQGIIEGKDELLEKAIEMIKF